MLSTSLTLNKSLLAIMVSSLSFIACGVNQNPHFKNKKFGQPENQGTTELPVTEPPEVTPPTQPEDPKPEDPRGPTDPEEPVNEVIGHYGFMGYFNLETVHRILKRPNGSIISGGGRLDTIVADLLGLILGKDPEETLSMQVTLTGDSSAVVRQVAYTEGGDKMSAIKGEDSQSGTQTLDWVLPTDEGASDCPKPFICIKRMIWKPRTGNPVSFCYRDMKTKKSTIIPFSANPHFSNDAFEGAIGSGIQSKPIEVLKLEGIVSCDEAQPVILDVNPVIYDVNISNLNDQNSANFIRKATNARLFANIALDLKYSLYNPDTNRLYIPAKGPYIDQRTRLYSKMRFFINNNDNIIVKIEQTFQSPLRTDENSTDAIIDRVRRKYGETAAFIAREVLKLDDETYGVQIVHSFEFCTHLAIVEKPFNHCTGRFQR